MVKVQGYKVRKTTLDARVLPGKEGPNLCIGQEFRIAREQYKKWAKRPGRKWLTNSSC